MVKNNVRVFGFISLASLSSSDRSRISPDSSRLVRQVRNLSLCVFVIHSEVPVRHISTGRLQIF